MVGIASIGKCIARTIRGAYRDRGGTVAIYVTILLPFLIGGALLTVDAGRLYSIQTFLQAAADARAIAAAAELDLDPDAIIRADRASDAPTYQPRTSHTGTYSVNNTHTT